MRNRPVALITGAGQGIGKAIASRLAADGASVAVVDVNEGAASAVAAEIVRAGGTASAHCADVTDRAAIFDVVDTVVSSHGSLDAMIANAGIVQVKPFEEITTDDWRQMMGVNAEGVFYCIQAAAQQMRSQGTGGRIICASSTAGRSGSDLALHYSASKAAVIAMVQASARALIADSITVNAYCPGLVDTEMQTTIDRAVALMSGGREGTYLSTMGERVGLGRFLTAEEIADVVAFLASPKAAGITGQTVTIDGGRMFQ